MSLFLIRQPPALPHRLQCSTIGRSGLNHRVRYGNGCVPGTHRHRNRLCSAEPLRESSGFSASSKLSLFLSQFSRAIRMPELFLQQINSNTTLTCFLRKEVIQPHLPIRLPCYDFTPVIRPAFDGSLLSVGSPASGISDSHGVTGGVYKTRERIHRGILIRDY